MDRDPTVVTLNQCRTDHPHGRMDFLSLFLSASSEQILKYTAKQTDTGTGRAPVISTRLFRSKSHGKKEARRDALLLRSCCTSLLQKRTDEGKQVRLRHEYKFESLFTC